MKKQQIYLDHAATTKVDPKVLKAMLPYLSDEFGNPSSIYSIGRKSKEALENARSDISTILNCRFDEIIFTGGGTESDNLAIFGAVYAVQQETKEDPKDLHIITSTIEHEAVLEPFKRLQKEGFDVTFLPVDKHGLVDPEKFKSALKKTTIFASIMYANNEIGTIEPIQQLSKIAHAHKNTYNRHVIFHTDACQAAGAEVVDTEHLGIDLLTLNGSKIYGPKGIGILFKRATVKLKPMILGGGQEKGLRSGTENVAGIVGIAEALKLAQKNREKENARLIKLRDKLIKDLQSKIPRTYLNGHPTSRLPNNVNLLILDIEGESMILYLDDKGIFASTGSACNSRSLEPSHVLTAIGLPKTTVHGSIRFTLGKETTEEDISQVVKTLPKIVENLRSISPIKIDEKKLNR